MKTLRITHNTTRAIITVMLFAVASFLLVSCKPVATEDEIEKMCVHLAELRNKPGDQAMIQSCISEAHSEEVSQKQARCRISAINKTEYWVRCRTGEARAAGKH